MRRSKVGSGHAFSIPRRLVDRRRGQRGITLLETLVAMVITATVLLPTLGFVTLTMGEQAAARTLTQETSNLAAADLALVRDVSNAKAVASSTAQDGSQRASNQLVDCVGALGDGQGGGGDVVLAMVSSENQRIVYSLEPLGSNPQLGHNLWRRTCPNLSTTSHFTLGDDLLNSIPPPAAMSPTSGFKLAQRVGSAISTCPDGSGGQDLDCRQVTMSLVSVDQGRDGSARPPVVIQAERRNTSYASPDTPPIARFSWDPNRVQDLDKVTFDASGSRDPRGGTLEYSWKFEPGLFESPVVAEEPAPQANGDPNFLASLETVDRTIAERPDYPDPSQPPPYGPIDVTLTVRNSAGKTNSVTQAVDLNPKNPKAVLQPSTGVVTVRQPWVAMVGQPTEFIPDLEVFSGTTIDDARWDWGDGTPPEEACDLTPAVKVCTKPGAHEYENPGTVFVKVTVTDSSGRSAFAQVALEVQPDTLYVTEAGQDTSACGEIYAPCRQIDHTLNLAQSLGKRKVHVAVGDYQRFSARSRIEVKGGFNDSFDAPGGDSVITGTSAGTDPVGGYGIYLHGVHNDANNKTRVERFKVLTPTNDNGTTQGIMVDAGSGDTDLGPKGRVELKDILVTGGKGQEPAGVVIVGGSWVSMDAVWVVKSPEAVGAGTSTYAVRVHDSDLYSKDGVFIAENGKDGVDGNSSTPAKATNGCPGPSGSSSGRDGGTGCGPAGYESGTGGYGGSWGWGDGNPGGGGWGGGGGAGGGAGGSCGNAYPGWGSSYNGRGGGGGGGGQNNGNAANQLWVGNTGAKGTNGGLGRGGGGGGGGGGCLIPSGGGGGAGGGPGAGGTAGTSVGHYGGGSFGVYAYNSAVSLVGGGINTGTGGKGGNGQPGGAGGDGGKGGNGADSSLFGGKGAGGSGGSGGGGGGGAGGGSGGPSIPFFFKGKAAKASTNGVNLGPSTGGSGGVGGAGTGQSNGGDPGTSGGRNGRGGVVGWTGGRGGDGAAGLAEGFVLVAT